MNGSTAGEKNYRNRGKRIIGRRSWILRLQRMKEYKDVGKDITVGI